MHRLCWQFSMYLLMSCRWWRVGHVLLWTLQDLGRKLAWHPLVRGLTMGKLMVLRGRHMRQSLGMSMVLLVLLLRLRRVGNWLGASLRAHHCLYFI
jgi:hypothetical protein